MKKHFKPHPDFDIDRFIRESLKEDVGSGDHTSLSTLPPDARNRARLIIKDDGILAGVELAQKIFRAIDPGIRMKIRIKDGARVRRGDIAFTAEGNARSLLTAERLILNCMQRMSGIATKTRRLADLCNPYKTQLLDTRKTTPLIRGLEKWAVCIGGGMNHRYGLYDMILIKNNHIDFAGGAGIAIEKARAYLKKKRMKLKIEVEARNLEEVKEILDTGKADRILLDNFSPVDIVKAVKLIGHRAETEISGGINEKNIRRYAGLGADFISSGALTHSIKSLDMSLTAF